MTTRERVIEMHKHTPCATLQVMGDACGVTRERVRQILKGKPTFLKHCIDCGNFFATRAHHALRCPDCRWTLICCQVCGKFTWRYTSDVLRDPNIALFCSRSCASKGQPKHGWRGPKRKPETPWVLMWHLYTKCALTSRQISEQLGVKLITVYKALRTMKRRGTGMRYVHNRQRPAAFYMTGLGDAVNDVGEPWVGEARSTTSSSKE